MKHNLFSFFCRGLQMCRNFLTTCTISGTRGKKLQADAALCGRSMVEMLGVLAIIGVLSVGAISGYSKAMLKYKLNKQAESFSWLLNYALQYSPQLKSNGIQTSYNEFFYKMNLIPDGMTYNAGRNMIYDNFNSVIMIYRNLEQNGTTETNVLTVSMDTSDISKEICRNLVWAAKENSHSLLSVHADRYPYRLYGDGYCTDGKKCLKNMTLNDTSEVCEICTEEFQQGGGCRLQIIWLD